jgi:hypothetical protein
LTIFYERVQFAGSCYVVEPCAARNSEFGNVMSRKNRAPLADRVARAAEAALAARHFVSAIDILVGIGWLDPGAVERWRRGQIDCLAEAVQVNLPRYRKPSGYLGLGRSREDCCRARRRMSAARRAAQRCASAEAGILRLRRHTGPIGSPPNSRRCGGRGDLLIMETPGPACLRCVGLDDLEYLPAGDALLTRRAKSKSSRHAVVVRFSRTRRRYERQGLLVEPQALAYAQKS